METIVMQRSILFIIVYLFIGAGANAFGGRNTDDTTHAALKRSLRVYYAARLAGEKPLIDGILNDQCWNTGEWAGDFIQWVPREGAKPSQPTQFKILYDDKNIYVAVRAFDNEPDKIIRKGGRRDEFNGDIVGVTFDSYHDHRTGFEFDVTAAGQKIDLILTNPSNADANWNAVWYAKSGAEDSAGPVAGDRGEAQESDRQLLWVAGTVLGGVTGRSRSRARVTGQGSKGGIRICP